jgi:RNA 2',3'-cyclic 3'-phosphodiesterase
MRLFVAITPPAGVLDEMEEAAAPLRSAWPGLRWTGQADWHVTLAFLNEVSDRVLPDLSRRMERAAHRHPTLELSVSGAGAFPAATRARVLWAGLHGDHGALATLTGLAASVAAGARRAGAPPPDEGRRYRPHLTLARCKAPADVSTLVGALTGFRGSSWTAGEIHLIHSRPGGQPRYETRGTWSLRPQS